jgi:hypothetical protein
VEIRGEGGLNEIGHWAALGMSHFFVAVNDKSKRKWVDQAWASLILVHNRGLEVLKE